MHKLCTYHGVLCMTGIPNLYRWNKMPKHIKISKHPDTKKFYVSDVCEFLSVEVGSLCQFNVSRLFSVLSFVFRNWWHTTNRIPLVPVSRVLTQLSDTLIKRKLKVGPAWSDHEAVQPPTPLPLLFRRPHLFPKASGGPM